MKTVFEVRRRIDGSEFVREVQVPELHEAHTPDCCRRILDGEEQRVAWAFMHPGYCRSCEGWGGATSYYDPSPAGVSLGSGYMVDFDPCPKCIDADVPACPHCATPLPADQEGDPTWERCACGWAALTGQGMPPAWDGWCSCVWERERAFWEDMDRRAGEEGIER